MNRILVIKCAFLMLLTSLSMFAISPLRYRIILATAVTTNTPTTTTYDDLFPSSNKVDWSRSIAGVQGGIPNRTTIYTNLEDGSSQAAISNAVVSCTSNQVVFLTNGYYVLTNRINMKEGVTIRGAGISNTTVYVDCAVAGFYNGAFATSTNRPITSGYTKGSTNIVCDLTSNVVAGYVIKLTQLNETNLVYARNATGDADYTTPYQYKLKHIALVTAVTSNSITFWPPLCWTFDASLSPVYSYSTAQPKGLFGLEDMSIISGTNDTTGNLISFNGCKNVWVKGCEVAFGLNANINLSDAVFCEVRSNLVHQSRGAGDGYGVLVYGPAGSLLIEDNIFFGHYCDIVLQQTVNSAILYNFCYSNYVSTWLRQYGNINVNHGAHSMMNLVEGNSAEGIINDGYWGSASHITIFRNNFHCTHPVYDKYRIAANLYNYSYFHTMVGNILGEIWATTNAYAAYERAGGESGYDKVQCMYALGFDNRLVLARDTKVADTLVRHGNYDYYNEAVVWDSSFETRTLSNSLFYTSMPTWWNTNVAWPPIGPDVSGYTNAIPAEVRFFGS